jgi:alkylation response protein AidB-like acyl-CoA dehydrogenase
MLELEAFRAEARTFLETTVPASLRGQPLPADTDGVDEPPELARDRDRYLDAMAERGWTAPSWPKEYGGGGLSGPQARVLQEEMRRLKLAPPVSGMGLSMIGPTLLVHGTEEQKKEFLPKIIHGEHRWCQGYSEPSAGSDLASLRTTAKLDASGERLIINGQKIWTSGAQFANWIFMLVRTDQSRKHGGISFVLVQMNTPGIEVKPIRLIGGHSSFCEVFFSDVVAYSRNVVGGLNQGWTVAKTLLNIERSGMGTASLASGNARRPGASAARLVAFAKQTVGERDGMIADGGLRDRIVAVMLDETALALTVARSSESRNSTGAPGPEMSMFKLYQSELGQRRDELLLSLRGTNAMVWDGSGVSAEELGFTRGWLSAKATTIAGGTSEIQRNIIAKRVLRLPTSS